MIVPLFIAHIVVTMTADTEFARYSKEANLCETEAKRLDFVTAKGETKRLHYYTEPLDVVSGLGDVTVAFTLTLVIIFDGRTVSILSIEASPLLVMRLFAASSCRNAFGGVVILYFMSCGDSQ